jgi:hypothetical protein
MKQGAIFITSLFVIACLTVVPIIADTNTTAMVSNVIETFDTGENTYLTQKLTSSVTKRTDSVAEYDWKTDGSKYNSKRDVKYLPVYPQALWRKPADAEGKNALGINGQFTRQGYNWIDIYPVDKADTSENPKAAEIPLLGQVRFLDCWVWGSNLNYSLEAYVRDYRGIIHKVDFGSLKFVGWKNLSAKIPANFAMNDQSFPLKNTSSTFVKFRLLTGPYERVNEFYLYIDQLKVLSDEFVTRFDGDELAYDDYEKNLWGATDAGN